MPLPHHGVGTVVDGKYRIVRSLGEGGMGFVYVAEHVFLRKNLALKMLRPEAAREPGVAARFEQEARATSLLEHENIVRVTDFGRTRDDELYLVMELLDGHGLMDELAERRLVPPKRAVWIATQLLGGLEAAQARGIVHRDLKPENVFIAGRAGAEVPKLVDFGLAKMLAPGAERLTTTGAVMGTPLYMAPEQVRGQADLDGRVDLHAVGVMLYEMLAGRTPYEGDTYGEIAHAILNGRPRPLVEAAPHVGEKLSAVVMKAFACERDDRYQTAAELRAALEDVAATEGALLAAAPPASPVADERAARHRRGFEETLGSPSAAAAALASSPELTDGVRAPSAPAAPATTTLDVPSRSALDPPPSAAQDSSSSAEAPRVVPSASAFEPPKVAALELSLEGVQPLALDRPAEATDAAEPPPSSRRAVLVAALVLIAALAAGGWWLSRPTAPPPPASVHVRVIDLPPGARVFLDGAPAPPAFEIPGSVEKHRLRVEARGYATRLLLLDATSDQTVDGHLERDR